ncbi:MAG: hypothetical protein WD423_02370 [Rhodothermales bacterium]
MTALGNAWDVGDDATLRESDDAGHREGVAADDVPAASNESAGGAKGEEIRRGYADAESRLADVDDDIEDLAERLVAAEGDRELYLAGLLREVRAARDSVRRVLNGVDPLAPETGRDGRPRLERAVAELEGTVERTHLAFLDRPEDVLERLRSRLRQADRTLSLLEGFLGNAPSEVETRYADPVSAVRSRYERLYRAVTAMDATYRADQAAGPEYERSRTDVTEEMSGLVTDLQLVYAEVQRQVFRLP